MLPGAAQTRATIVVLMALGSSGAFAAPRYFPSGALGDDSAFIENWYSGQLAALKEQPLCCGVEDPQTIVRFTWLRSFHHPVAIRLFRSGDGRWMRCQWGRGLSAWALDHEHDTGAEGE